MKKSGLKNILKPGTFLLTLFAALLIMLSGLPGTITIARAEGAYSEYMPGDEWDDFTAVNFHGYEWYIIKDNSTDVSEGTLTLYLKGTMGKTVFNENGDTDYGRSKLKEYLDSLTAEGGSFADVAHVIKPVDLTDVGVTGAKLYPLSGDEWSGLFKGRRTDFLDNDDSCWLRDSSDDKVRTIAKSLMRPIYDPMDPYGSPIGFEPCVGEKIGSSPASDEALIRPALQLDLSKVIFSPSTMTFKVKPYSYFIPEGSDSNMDLNKKLVTFNGRYWHIIDVDSESEDSGTVTLLLAHSTETMQFNSASDTSGNKYNTSAVAKYLEDLTAKGGDFAGVANAIKPVDLPDVEVTGARLYLLSSSEAEKLPDNLRKYSISLSNSGWWLRTPVNSSNVSYVAPGGNISDQVYLGSLIVRPALQLDLSSVLFSKEDKKFTVPKTVFLTGGANASRSGGETTQSDLDGRPMTDVTYTADNGYYFPEFQDIVKNGVTARWIDDATVTVSGTPGAVVRIKIPDAVELIKIIVTFKVVNGSWDDGKRGNIRLTVTCYEDSIIKLKKEYIPGAGTKPDAGYKEGGWDIKPDTGTVITKDITFTYTYADKDAPEIKKVPESKALTYSGSEQELVVKGEASSGSMLYALGNEEGPLRDFTTSIPRAANAGTYYVWYKAVVEEDHKESVKGSVPVTISKAVYGGKRSVFDLVPRKHAEKNRTLTLPDIPEGGKYAENGDVNGDSSLIKDHSVSGNILTFSTTAQDDYLTAIITLNVTGALNYSDYAVSVKITSRDSKDVTITGGDKTVKYGCEDFTLSGTLDGAAADLRWSSSDPSVAEIGETSGKVTVKSAGSTHITAVYESDASYGEGSITLTVEKTDPVIKTEPEGKTGLKYNGEEQELVTPGEAEGGVFRYKLGENGAYDEEIPKGKEAGDYTVFYYVAGDGNHNDTEEKSIAVSMEKEEEKPVDPSNGRDIPISDPLSPKHRTDAQSVTSVSLGNAVFIPDLEKNVVIISNVKIDLNWAFSGISSVPGYNASAKHRYKSSNRSVVKIDKKGMASSKKYGEADITFEQKEKGGSWTQIGDKLHIYIQLPEMEKNASFSASEIDPKAGLSAYAFLRHTTYSPTKWISTNTSVATVDDRGNIQVIGHGKTNIIARYGEGKKGSKNKYKTKLKIS